MEVKTIVYQAKTIVKGVRNESCINGRRKGN